MPKGKKREKEILDAINLSAGENTGGFSHMSKGSNRCYMHTYNFRKSRNLFKTLRVN
jgi:hypothetical protein